MKRRYISVLLLIIISGFIIYQQRSKLISNENTNAHEKVFRSVYTVIDGDTFWMKDEQGGIEKIRLIGIDAPESRKSAHKDVQYFGKEAKAFLQELLKSKKVTFEYDVEKQDQYGRTLAYVYLDDGVFLNDYLVRNGYATCHTYKPNVKYQKQLLKSEKFARENKLGLWK